MRWTLGHRATRISILAAETFGAQLVAAPAPAGPFATSYAVCRHAIITPRLETRYESQNG